MVMLRLHTGDIEVKLGLHWGYERLHRGYIGLRRFYVGVTKVLY